MRACLDTNLLISYLLAKGRAGVPLRIVRAALHSEFEAIIGITTIDELVRSIEQKPWLRRNVMPDQATALVDALRTLGVVVEEPDQPIPEVSRDFADDYLLALSEKHRVDYLVSGDKDLLVLGEHAGVRIVSPAGFVAILDKLAAGSCEQ